MTALEQTAVLLFLLVTCFDMKLIISDLIYNKSLVH